MAFISESCLKEKERFEKLAGQTMTEVYYRKCDWISISRRSWCSTADFCSWDLNSTCTRIRIQHSI